MALQTEIKATQGESKTVIFRLVKSDYSPADLTTATQFELIVPREADGFGSLRMVQVKPTFLPAAINTTTGYLTLPAHGFAPNEIITLTTSGVLPTGLALATNYYIQVIDVDTIAFSATQNGAVLIPTTQGSGTHTIEFSVLVVSGNPLLGAIAASFTAAILAAGRPGVKQCLTLKYLLGGVPKVRNIEALFTLEAVCQSQ